MILPAEETLTQNANLAIDQGFKASDVVLITDRSFNLLRKRAGFQGDITNGELQALGDRPTFFKIDGDVSNVVAISKVTFHAYRALAGYTGEISRQERKRARKDIRNMPTTLPPQVPVLVP